MYIYCLSLLAYRSEYISAKSKNIWGIAYHHGQDRQKVWTVEETGHLGVRLWVSKLEVLKDSFPNRQRRPAGE